jgi:hypothetical protein
MLRSLTIPRMPLNSERWTLAKHEGQVVINLRRRKLRTARNSARKPILPSPLP